ncbi:hypothetical protein [Pseudomonas syringae group genomosp. 3]|uniref:Uncharacterized protein n=1 Tax=Pseudomonas syringae pv. persicae TaxID=237306 RepID=A0AB38E9T5_9PSED|nr:hypothetical protein [Pseudomonas syringae group genomosp. 3]SOQ06545.1 hypothetical protein NCPPB2254_00882 [Pseudomonas syringae pv. persicae]SOQ06834.1 hypothetical protein CFBP1573P_01133 [Pseudomonas syringae pv. persicae]
MPDITVKTTKSFNTDGLGVNAKYVKRGAEFTVDESVARNLHRNGLVEDFEAKTAEDPENKKAPEPVNKAAKPPAKK